MVRLALVFALVLAATPLQAQTCTPTPLVFVYWGSYGSAHIPESTLTTGWVPEDEAWWVQDAAASIDVPPGSTLPYADYILLDNTRYSDGTSWYLTGIAKASGTNTTPVVVTNRPRWLLPGHRLSVRTNIAIPSTVRMGIHATGVKVPYACFARALGLEAGGVSVSGGVTVPDFGPLLQAAQAFVTALQTVH